MGILRRDALVSISFVLNSLDRMYKNPHDPVMIHDVSVKCRIIALYRLSDHDAMVALIFKVFTLTLKTVSKPLASRFEQYVMGHPKLRSKVINIAQWIHTLEVSIDRGAQGKTGRVFVGDMSEEKSIQLASKVASESFVYGTALILLVLEMQRKDEEDKEKKKKANEEKEHNAMLHRRHEEMDLRIAQEQYQMRRILERIEERVLALEATNAKRSRWPWPLSFVQG